MNGCGVLSGWHAIHPLSLISRSEKDSILNALNFSMR
jgi:hypothetical protein